MMRVILLLVAVFALAPIAQGGTVAGFVLGRMSAPGEGATSSESSIAVWAAAPGHDVIACAQHTQGGCIVGYTREPISPLQYAGNQGYRALHKTGVAVSPNGLMILMEVSK